MLGIREGVIHFFRSKLFCLTKPKNFVGEPFCAVFQKISGFDEIFGGEWGGIRISRRKVFVSQCQKNVGEPISVSLFLGVVKFYASDG